VALLALAIAFVPWWVWLLLFGVLVIAAIID
jgi:hypothetical protein